MSDQLFLKVAFVATIVFGVWGIYGNGGWSFPIGGMLVQVLQKYCRCPFCHRAGDMTKLKPFFVRHESCQHEFSRLVFLSFFPLLRLCWGAVKAEREVLELPPLEMSSEARQLLVDYHRYKREEVHRAWLDAQGVSQPADVIAVIEKKLGQFLRECLEEELERGDDGAVPLRRQSGGE